MLPFPVAESGRNRQKALLHIATNHLSIYTSICNLPFKSSSPYKLIFRKPLTNDILAIFGHFRWAKLSKVISTLRDLSFEHIHRSLLHFFQKAVARTRSFFKKLYSWLYSPIRPLPVGQISSTNAAWSKGDDRQADGQPRYKDPQLWGILVLLSVFGRFRVFLSNQ